MADKTKISLEVLMGFAASIIAIWASMPEMASSETKTADALVGVWSCQSIYGGPFTGRSCRTFPWLKLNANKSYSWGSEQGKWEFKDGVLHLSARKGKGRLNSDGQLVIEYESKGTRYRQVLYKRN